MKIGGKEQQEAKTDFSFDMVGLKRPYVPLNLRLYSNFHVGSAYKSPFPHSRRALPATREVKVTCSSRIGYFKSSTKMKEGKGQQ
jgi:hypothetical protein